MVHHATLLLMAADFAARKHSQQRRKNGDVPYVNHAIGVAHSLAHDGGIVDPIVLASALLHDTLEDTETTFAELASVFGAEIAGIVQEVTDDKRLPKAERKRQQVAHARVLSGPARLVKLADKLFNLRDLVSVPPSGWDAQRIQGYFCWAHAVVTAIGAVNEPLCRALGDVFATHICIGGETIRAVPADELTRQRLLEAYYLRMSRLCD